MDADKKFLLIMRHADSEPISLPNPDHERKLSALGQNQPSQIAEQIINLKLQIDRALISSATRTRQTWELLQSQLKMEPATLFIDELYNASLPQFLKVLKKYGDDSQSLLVIAHFPGVAEICRYLSKELCFFEPAECAVLSTEGHFNYEQLQNQSFHFEQTLSAV